MSAQPIRRPPVIVVMGHIDHGKTTLLDYIRQTNLVESESGGITQAVGAYEVTRTNEAGQPEKLTFIDTPGHEAFSAMREHGAQIADVAILVVSAEDGVKPQTVESLKTIQAQNLALVVAINKIDKPNARPEQIKQQLAEHDVLLEGYGGTVPNVEISAKTGAGVKELLDLVWLTAELADLKGDPAKVAEGFVLETARDERSGIRATLIVKDGTLRTGDWLVAGRAVSKIKQLKNWSGQTAASLSFSSPAVVIGFSDLPAVGAAFQSFADKNSAAKFAALQTDKSETAVVEKTARLAGNDAKQVVKIPLVVKADVAGALAATLKEINKLETETAKIKLLHQGIGAITENDVKRATADRQSVILGFNVKVETGARRTAERFGIAIVTFPIIYKLSEWLAEELEKRRPKAVEEAVSGRATIIKAFSRDKEKQVVGGAVREGKITVGRTVSIVRRETAIGQGKIIELQKQKLAVKEVAAGQQFGMMLESKITLAAGDVLEAVEKQN